MLFLNNGFDYVKVINHLIKTYFESSPFTQEEVFKIISDNVNTCVEGDGENIDQELLDLLFENIPNNSVIKEVMVLPYFLKIILPKEKGEDVMFDFPLIILEITEVEK